MLHRKAATSQYSPNAAHPVGLEYTNATVTCYFRNGTRLSSGDLVLVGEAAEDLLSADPVLGEVDLRWPGVSLSRRQLAQGAVRPGCVVVDQVFGQYPAQVMVADDQQPVEELGGVEYQAMSPSRRGDRGEVGAGSGVRRRVEPHHLVLEHGVPAHHAAARWP
jgi:hypothetical protein